MGKLFFQPVQLELVVFFEGRILVKQGLLDGGLQLAIGLEQALHSFLQLLVLAAVEGYLLLEDEFDVLRSYGLSLSL